MKQFMKILPLVFLVPVIIIASCPVAFAVDVTDSNVYSVASDKPTVTDYSGYYELLFEQKSTGYRFVVVISWTYASYVNSSSEFLYSSDFPVINLTRTDQYFTFNASTNSGVTGYVSLTVVDSGVGFTYGGGTLTDDVDYTYTMNMGSSYALIGFHCYGPRNHLTSTGPLETFLVSYSSDAVVTHQLNAVIANFKTLLDLVDDEIYSDELQTIIDNLTSLDSSVSNFEAEYKSQMTKLFGYLDSFLSDLDSIIENTDEIESKLDDLWDLLFNIYNSVSNIEYYMPYVYGELIDINSKLQKIIDALNSKGSNEEKLTQPDNSDMDNYYDIENGLISGDTNDVGGAVNVQINQNAMATIWDFVERAVNSNPKVFGMIITILSLGIIALILGR